MSDFSPVFWNRLRVSGRVRFRIMMQAGSSVLAYGVPVSRVAGYSRVISLMNSQATTARLPSGSGKAQIP